MPDESQLWSLLDAGRHALQEEAVATPIFSALTRDEWRREQREVNAEERFRRDPLTAPLPVLRAVPPIPLQGGRHRRRRERTDTHAWGISA